MFKISTSRLLAAVICASAVTLTGATPQAQRLTWSELGPATEGKGKITMVLSSGTQIHGEVLSVEPHALIVNMTKTSNRREVNRGRASVPRTSVSAFETRQCGAKWRVILTIGIPGALLAATAAAMNAQSPPVDSREAAEVGLVIAGGGIVAGHFLGRRLDCRVTQTTVVP